MPNGEMNPVVSSPLTSGQISKKRKSIIGPHPETILDKNASFDVVGYKLDGPPAIRRVDVFNRQVLTTAVTKCTTAWITTRDRSRKKGAHALCHVYPNGLDPMASIKSTVADFCSEGLNRFSFAYVVGATTDPSKYIFPPTKKEIAKIAKNAERMVKGLKKLGFRVIKN